MEITLSENKIAIIDDEDFNKIKDMKFYLMKGRNTFYAYTKDSKLLHRIIMKAKKGQFIDHINGDGLDNRKANLRFCSISQNGMNRKSYSKSGFKGVWYVPLQNKTNPYQAQITINNKSKHIGYFKTGEEAARAYNKEAKNSFGEFALLNKLPKLKESK